jgi:hypothetical protein
MMEDPSPKLMRWQVHLKFLSLTQRLRLKSRDLMLPLRAQPLEVLQAQKPLQQVQMPLQGLLMPQRLVQLAQALQRLQQEQLALGRVWGQVLVQAATQQLLQQPLVWALLLAFLEQPLSALALQQV